MSKRNPGASKPEQDTEVEVVTSAVNDRGEDGADKQEHSLELAAVKEWQERIDECKTFYKDRFEGWDELRKAIVLHFDGEDDKNRKIVNVKLILATLKTLVPHIYARNPDVSVKPAESVTPDRYQVTQSFARTCEIVVDREFLDGHLKQQAKRVVRSVLQYGLGWLKVGFQTTTRQDPLIMRQIEDSRTELERLEYVIAQVKDDDTNQEQNEARRAELVDILKGLEAKVNVLVAKGFTFDMVSSKDVFVPPSLAEILDYRWSPWIIHRLWYKPDEACQVFSLTKEQVGKATLFESREPSAVAQQVNNSLETKKGAEGWVAAYEIWDKQDGVIRTMLDGYECWVRPPYAPTLTAQRFYSLFMLGFNFVDGEFMPVPDVEGWLELQEEYNRTRSAYAEFRKRSIPFRIFNEGIIDGDTAKKLINAESNEMVGIKAPPEVPVSNLVAVAEVPPIDPRLYDTAPIRNDLDTVSGVQDAARGPVFQAKTATEAEIQQSGLVTRLTDPQDAIEDFVGEIARYVIEVGIQAFDLSDAQRIAGPSAVWPKLSKDEAYHLLDIDIRPGTSGRPNLLREQQAWAALLPVVQQMMLQIAEMEAKGLVPIANCLKELLRETFRRADERLDPDKFVPALPAAQPTQPATTGAPGNVTGQPGTEQPLGGNGVTVLPTGPGPRLTPGQENPGNLGS